MKECDSYTGEEATGSHFNSNNFAIAASQEKTVAVPKTSVWKPAWSSMGQFYVPILTGSGLKYS